MRATNRISSCKSFFFVVLAGIVINATTRFSAGQPSAQAEGATYLYVSMVPEQKIQVYRLDPTNGMLTAVDTMSVDGAAGSLAVDRPTKVLFASLRTTSMLGSFRIDSTTGKLSHLSTAALPAGENAAYVKTDRTGHWLLSASYAAGKI